MRAVQPRWIMLSLVGLCVLLVLLTGCSTSHPTIIEGAGPTPTPMPTQNSAASTHTIVAKSSPISLIIPAIQLHATVEPVGIQANADLATPIDNPWEDVGWYTEGPYPGERGSAVIDGHLDRPGGLPAVFWKLHSLQVGNEVQVENATGRLLHFRVTRIAFYTPQQAPLQEIFGNRGGSYLNLITCAGDWIPSQGQTTLRVVVYTVLVP